MYKYIGIFLTLLLLSNCQISEKEIIGEYTVSGHSNCIDTIIIMNDFKYIQKIYNKKNKIRIIKSESWNYSGISRISLRNLFINLDRNIEIYPELLDDGMNVDIPIGYKNGSINFCVGDLTGEICYKKN